MRDLGKKFKIRAIGLMQTTILECDQAFGRVRRKPGVRAEEKKSKFERANYCKRQFLSAINLLRG